MADAPLHDAPVHDYDYALVRLVPRVCAGVGVNVGVVLHARRARFLGLRLAPDPAAVAARCGLDAELVARTLGALARVCDGEGPIGRYPESERFHWLTAPRSAAVQPSPVHTGRTRDCAATLDALFAAYVGANPDSLADAGRTLPHAAVVRPNR